MDDGAYGFRNKETGEWNGLMGELLAQVPKIPRFKQRLYSTRRPGHGTVYVCRKYLIKDYIYKTPGASYNYMYTVDTRY